MTDIFLVCDNEAAHYDSCMRSQLTSGAKYHLHLCLWIPPKQIIAVKRLGALTEEYIS
jgi:hypothetical protein